MPNSIPRLNRTLIVNLNEVWVKEQTPKNHMCLKEIGARAHNLLPIIYKLKVNTHWGGGGKKKVYPIVL